MGMKAGAKGRTMEMERSFGAVVAAAGSSSRMGSKGSKVLEELSGKPVLRHVLETLAQSSRIGEICVVCRKEDREKAEEISYGLSVPVRFALGGQDRQASVENGIRALSPGFSHVLIQDGARPLTSPETVEAVCREALKWGAATAAVPVKDTIKQDNGEGFVLATPPRDRLWAAQTPQAFSREGYLSALELAKRSGKSYTDDCQLMEAAGERVRLVQGDPRNIKLTTPEDRVTARAFLGKGEANMRIGHGYDVHRLTEGRKLILGGVEIPFEKGLLGHSDADVLTHAVMDALLGAAGMGDIGRLFPDTDPRFEGADSLGLLSQVARRLREKGFSIGNVDVTLIAQRPKVAGYISEMERNLAKACGTGEDRINVKATTEEKLGFTGTGEGMAAHAVCLLETA